MYKQTNIHKNTLIYIHAYYELTRKSVIKSHRIILCYLVTCFDYKDNIKEVGKA